MENSQKAKPDLKWLEGVANLLDTKFRIPGTEFRFGMDPLVGLIPYLGDIITYAVSALLIFYMARFGASGKLVMKMLFNITLDLIIGGIPIAGQIGDFILRANDRNIKLYKEYIEAGKHSGSGMGMIIALLIVMIAIPVLFAALAYTTIGSLLHWIGLT